MRTFRFRNVKGEFILFPLNYFNITLRSLSVLLRTSLQLPHENKIAESSAKQKICFFIFVSLTSLTYIRKRMVLNSVLRNTMRYHTVITTSIPILYFCYLTVRLHLTFLMVSVCLSEYCYQQC